jgi:2-polyprenyl-6-methoxyphenol hydroxylase-like FAD-dependent oxidoreductase
MPVLHSYWYANSSIRRYRIPTDEGDVSAGNTLVNFVWYYNIPSPSASLDEILTDSSGVLHRNSVRQGHVSEAAWKKQKAISLPSMSPEFAELVDSVSEPLVTKISDGLRESPVHCDGHVVLVGDALATFRPHLALATDHAARNVLNLRKVREGSMTWAQYDRDALRYARRILSISRVVGLLGQGTKWELVKSIFSHTKLLIRQALGFA